MMPQAHDEALIRLSLQHFEVHGEYRDPLQFQHALAAGPPADAVRSGGCFVFLDRLFRPLVGAPAGGPTGAPNKPNKATEKLDAASAAIEARAASLAEKASTLRATAMTLNANGDKKSAVQMLRRSKAIEKQAETAQATQMSLEQQRDLLESAVLQKSVSDALAQAVKKSKRSTRGLLSKAESAVEDTAELNEVSSEIAQVMGELGQQGTEAFDEDELAAELAEMCEAGAPKGPNASPDSVVASTASAEMMRRFPRAPATLVHAIEGVAVTGSGV